MLFGGLADWGYVANIVLAAMSVFTAIVTACMLVKQHQLQQEQYTLDREKLEAQQLEHQPSFQFTRTEDKLIISNQGGVLAAPIKSTVYSMIIVQTDKSEDAIEYRHCIYCHPVRYYERFGISTLNLGGELDVYKFKPEDRRILLNRVKEIHEGLFQWKFRMPQDPIISVQSATLSDLIKIEYVDMYHKPHIIYYKDSHVITKERFEQLVKISRQVPFGVYGVEDIITDKIILQAYATDYELTV